jgi:predicted nucleic acid-binding protein
MTTKVADRVVLDTNVLLAATDTGRVDEKVSERLLALLDDVGCAGKQVHDANIVATMLVHGVDTLVTINTDDFARFEKLLRIRKL